MVEQRPEPIKMHHKIKQVYIFILSKYVTMQSVHCDRYNTYMPPKEWIYHLIEDNNCWCKYRVIQNDLK